jgi:hypothetical protein
MIRDFESMKGTMFKFGMGKLEDLSIPRWRGIAFRGVRKIFSGFSDPAVHLLTYNEQSLVEIGLWFSKIRAVLTF